MKNKNLLARVVNVCSKMCERPRGCGACSFVLEVSAELQGIQISSRTRSALCNAIRVLRVGVSVPAEKVGCLCLTHVFFSRVH